MKEKPSRMPATDPDEGLLTIGALAKATRIPVPTLRTWERRYRSPRPTRKPSGHRLYPVGLVAHLQKVAVLLDRGHRPGEILPLTSEQLDSLLALPGTAGMAADPRGVDLGEMMEAVRQFDRDALIGVLRRKLIRLGPLPFLQLCAGALMVEVGAAWHAGKLEIRGIGIVEMDRVENVPIGLLVELTSDIQRLPDDSRERPILGVRLPLISIDAMTASAPSKVALALDRMGLKF